MGRGFLSIKPAALNSFSRWFNRLFKSPYELMCQQ